MKTNTISQTTHEPQTRYDEPFMGPLSSWIPLALAVAIFCICIIALFTNLTI